MEIPLIRQYGRYSRFIEQLLRWSGVWPTSDPIVERILAGVAILSSLTLAVGTLNYCIHNISNVMVLTKNMGFVISLFATSLKVCIFLSHHEDLLYLNETLSARFTVDLDNCAADREQQLRMLPRLSAFARILYALAVTAGTTYILSGVVLPLIAFSQGKYVPVCSTIYPFVSYEMGDALYWAIQLNAVLSGFFVWTVMTGVDSALGLYTLQMCGELRLLADKFERLSASADYERNLRECVERHHLLMRSKDALERLFGVLTIWLAVTSAVVQCAIVFQVSQVIKQGASFFKIGNLFSYIFVKLVQAFAYAWYGHLITEESELCLNSMYNSRWPESGDHQFMSDVLIVLKQKPLIFKAKGCMYLRMEIFTKIVNTAVSYFFLLQTLDENSGH